MGLAAPKKRRKISHDPQNTTWSRDATSFGHRQLLSQGWTPGQTLGAATAPQAKFFTKASASHVRLVLREENLGLGAKTGSGVDHGECTGLGGLQDLLGRLNGKSSGVIEKERKSRDDLKRKLWAEKRYGGLGFVSGGLLVGGDLVEKVKGDTSKDDSTVLARESVAEKKAGDLGMKTSDTTQSSSQEANNGAPQKTKRKRRLKVETETGETSVPVVELAEGEETVLASAVHSTISETNDSSVVSKRQRKEEKARRKIEKAQRKLERRRKKEDKLRGIRPTEEVPELLPKEGLAEASPTRSTIKSLGDNTKIVPTAIVTGNRLAVRQRHIQQKKRAMLDLRALNEILMVKA